MARVKVCRLCGEHNRPDELACIACGASLIDVAAVDAALLERPAEEIAADEGGAGGGETVREPSRTVREGGATVREGSQTVGEGGATVRETPAPADEAPQPLVGGLPPTLAAKYRVVDPMPASGAEAELYVVAPLSDDSARRVAKVYRHSISPKADVLERIRTIHPAHVVELEDFGRDGDHWWELMEFVEQGSLRDLIKREGPKLPEPLVRNILVELNDALGGLHELDLVHSDFKPGNILVRSLDPLDLVLTDFGTTSVMASKVHFTQIGRTMSYAAPEAVGAAVVEEGKLQNVAGVQHASDYWSLGIAVVELLQGRHPFHELPDAAISLQLATQDTNELTRDIEDPHWRKLCRGLLRRSPDDRWGFDAVSKWIADPNDPSLDVADEVAPATGDQPSAATIDFDGVSYGSPSELGQALSQDWDKATSYWRRRYQDVLTWAFDGLGQTELGEALRRLDDIDVSLDAQVFGFICALAPNEPLRFRGTDVSTESVTALGEQALAGDDQARSALLTLHHERIPTLAGALAEGIADIGRRWEELDADYKRQRRELAKHWVAGAVPDLDDDLLVTLLVASLPGSPHAERLRDQARAASTADALQCDWFRDLGDPESMSVATLSMVPHLRSRAERDARRSQLEAGHREKTGRKREAELQERAAEERRSRGLLGRFRKKEQPARQVLGNKGGPIGWDD